MGGDAWTHVPKGLMIVLLHLSAVYIANLIGCHMQQFVTSSTSIDFEKTQGAKE